MDIDLDRVEKECREFMSVTPSKSEFLALIDRLRAAEYELSIIPAKWSDDSSLETWFPLTSDELENLRKEVAELRAYKQSAEAKIKEYEQATKLSGEVNAKLVGELLEMQDKLAAMESQEPFAYCFTDVTGKPTALCDSPDHAHPNDGRLITSLYAKPVPADKAVVPKGTNRYGLDVGYLSEKLGLLLRDIDSHKPDEAARVLARLSKVADESVLREPEFSPKPAVAVPEITTAMYMAGCNAYHDNLPFKNENVELIFKAMLAAAPSHGQQSAEYRCHKCNEVTPPPEPFKFYVRCACGAATAATAALVDDRCPSHESEGE